MRLLYRWRYLLCLAVLGFPKAGIAADEPVLITNTFTTTTASTNQWITCASFRNVSQRPIVAVQFEFKYIDAFDSVIQTNRGDRVGDFAPGVSIEGATSIDQLEGTAGNVSQHAATCWRIPIVAGSLSKITAVVAKVRYGDGEIWVNPGPPVIFTAKYMAGPGDLPHPEKVRCGGANIPWNPFMKQWIEKGLRKPISCYNSWLQANGYAPYVPPTPTPKPT